MSVLPGRCREFSKIFTDVYGFEFWTEGRSCAYVAGENAASLLKPSVIPWQAPEGHSYLSAAICFADLNRVTFRRRQKRSRRISTSTGRTTEAACGRKEGRTSSEITGAKCAREKIGEEEEEEEEG